MEKTIVEKLKLTSYNKKLILNKPKNQNYLTELTDAETTLRAGSYDLIFAFVLSFDEMKQLVKQIAEGDYLAANGYLFMAYPKKDNKLYPTFIHRDEILGGLNVDEEGYVPESTLKFSRMVAMDETFTVVGIKEAKKAKNKKTTAKSQIVADYIVDIPKVEAYLQGNPAILEFFQQLTPGYQRGWARYIYSAKQVETQEKRQKEMLELLTNGFKSRELYRQSLQ